ncbi:hypothetical protein KB221_13405 [Aquidulcibacter paucihalophilus]|nr:hypothetical protein KB221_13405 [Aquidulcibacter paucihalophilus]
MAMESERLAERLEAPDPKDRRARSERRGPDRRRTDSRINPEAPRRSLLIVIGAVGVGISTSIIAITLLAGELLEAVVPVSVLAFEVALLLTSTLWLALGAIELRLIEIRLELMMMNGGTRGADRRQAPRRGDRKETSGEALTVAPARRAKLNTA